MLLSIKIYDAPPRIWESLLDISLAGPPKKIDRRGIATDISTHYLDNCLEIHFFEKDHPVISGKSKSEVDKLVALLSKSYYSLFRSIFLDNDQLDLFGWESEFEIECSILDLNTEEEIHYLKAFVSKLGYEVLITESDFYPGCKSVKIRKRSPIKYIITQVYAFLQFAEKITTPHQIRHGLIAHELSLLGSCKIIDLGCGEGDFIFNKLKVFYDEALHKITGVEIDTPLFEGALKRRNTVDISNKIEIINADICSFDDRFKSYDTVIMVEVIEHLEKDQLPDLEKVVFEFIKPDNFLVSTPNADFNIYCTDLLANGMRHPDHKFEWSKEDFLNWALIVSSGYNYEVEYFPIGLIAPNNSSMSQLIRFKKCN